jgi:salicylate hydroxylase
MLPFNAQGGNQALEDAGALLSLFSNLEKGSKQEIKERMKLFDLVRPRRAGRQQIISSVHPSEVSSLGDRLKGFEDGNPGPGGETAIERIVRELRSVFLSE